MLKCWKISFETRIITKSDEIDDAQRIFKWKRLAELARWRSQTDDYVVISRNHRNRNSNYKCARERGSEIKRERESVCVCVCCFCWCGCYNYVYCFTLTQSHTTLSAFTWVMDRMNILDTSLLLFFTKSICHWMIRIKWWQTLTSISHQHDTQLNCTQNRAVTVISRPRVQVLSPHYIDNKWQSDHRLVCFDI